MKFSKVALCLVAILALNSLLASCGGEGDITKDTDHISGETSSNISNQVPSGSDVEVSTGSPQDIITPDTTPMQSEPITEPIQGAYIPTSETVITFDEQISVSGSGATIEGNIVTITEAGSYLMSGCATDAQIIIDTIAEQKVTLVLNGLSLSCSNGPAMYIKSAPKKVVLYTAENSVNILSDATGYIVADELQTDGVVYPNACIYACDDLTLDGKGELHINGNADKGINTKDDLVMNSGKVVITSVGVGMRGNDSVTINGGETYVTSGADGIKSANIETEGKGYIQIDNGEIYITATGDGISAATDLNINGGTMVITTQDTINTSPSVRSAPIYESLRGPGGMPPGGFGGGGMMEGNTNKSTISAKGLKASSTLTISNGKMTITSADDGIHSNDAVWVKNGSIYISTNDDGIHANNTLTISGGITQVAESYEGLEANQITISGGTNRITASDDGTNANGGTSMGGRPGGWGSNSSSSSANTHTPLLTISGGYTVINANGDGIDSNGNIVMTGGTLYVYGPTNNGNGPIDIGDGNYSMTVSGGILLAVGSSGMAESAKNNGQAVFAAKMNTLQGGTLIGIKDADGNMLACFEVPKAIASIVYSSPNIQSGETYTIVYGGSGSQTADGVVDVTTYTGYTEMGSLEAY